MLLVEGRLSVGAVLVSHCRHSFAFRHEHIVYVWHLVSNSQPFHCIGFMLLKHKRWILAHFYTLGALAPNKYDAGCKLAGNS